MPQQHQSHNHKPPWSPKTATSHNLCQDNKRNRKNTTNQTHNKRKQQPDRNPLIFCILPRRGGATLSPLHISNWKRGPKRHRTNSDGTASFLPRQWFDNQTVRFSYQDKPQTYWQAFQHQNIRLAYREQTYVAWDTRSVVQHSLRELSQEWNRINTNDGGDRVRNTLCWYWKRFLDFLWCIHGACCLSAGFESRAFTALPFKDASNPSI
jgi:hypothetical protein